ncbi:MAG: hypothetical protein ACXABF_14875, partial [Candidatus Thorarchaeota archaeon]
MRNVAGLKSLTERNQGEAISAILDIIIHDSRKHTALCDAMIRLETGETRRVPNSSMVLELRETILKHIEF